MNRTIIFPFSVSSVFYMFALLNDFDPIYRAWLKIIPIMVLFFGVGHLSKERSEANETYVLVDDERYL